MCGIAGIMRFGAAPRPVEERLLLAMRDTMAHRGPDGVGAWLSPDRRLGLAHRRLAIIDLSPAAAQPMSTADGRLTIVFNGEIYNHAALRRELEAAGCRTWQTDHADTEVILQAFVVWGIECLDRLRGMFAFALWDAREATLWLARDRIGIKPLYYATDAAGVVFASEIKAILADRQRSHQVDEEAFFHYLSFLTTPAPQTLFAGIRKLPAGSWLRVKSDGTIVERRWWDALDHATPLSRQSDAAAAEELLATLRDAVSLHKVADVPLGVFLSGGIDSSTNVALFAESESRPVHTFSIGYAGEHRSVADELPYARMMAERIGADHHEIRLTQQDLLDFLPRMVRLQDEPIADPVCVPVYYLSKLARDSGVTVAQVGEGADELFWGYPSWRMLMRLEQANGLPVPALLKHAAVGMLEAAGQGERTATELLRRGAAGRPLFWGGAEAFPETLKRRLLSPRLRERFRDLSSWDVLAPLHRRFVASAADPSPLTWMTYLDLNLRLPELLLMRVDKMAMGVGLEARVPFLDHEVVELAMRLPSAMKTRNGELKYLLKRAVTGLLPDAILNRPKQGFAVPVREWFFDRLGAEAHDLLERFCARTDFFDAKEMRRFLAEGRGAQSWYLFNFALWHEEFIAPA
jgi:asparagine synthase (glutamine-hydrolysing)